MATGKLSKRGVDGATSGFLWDDELKGFGLRVSAGGAKSYIYQYRMGGRETLARRHTIGTHGSPWTPVTARKEAERLAIMVKQGIDPRQADRKRRREQIDLLFSSYAESFLQKYVRPSWPSSYEFAEGILRLHVVPVLGDRVLTEIERSDIAELLDRVPVGQPALRRNIYAVVRRLFRWAAGRGDLDRSPLENFEPPPTVASRERVLSDLELALIWQATGSLGYPFAPLFQLLIATGQRREEVAGLRWDELDRTTSEWVLPAQRAKNGRAHIVPLSSLSRSVLDGLGGPGDWPKSGFVFSTTGTTAVSGHSRAKSRLDAKIAELLGQLPTVPAMPAWRVHDFRRTVATGFQKLGIRFEVTEAVLNHVSGAKGGVAGVYQRHDWKEEKHAALQQWADHLRGVTAIDDTVVALPARRLA